MPRLQFCVFVFCLIFAQAFSISIKAPNTPFCTLFPVGVPQFAHPPVIPDHRAPASLVGALESSPPHPPATGRQEVTSCPSWDADYDLEPGGVWKSVSGPPHPSLPAGRSHRKLPAAGAHGHPHCERAGRQPLGAQGGVSVGSLWGIPDLSHQRGTDG